LAHSKKSLPVCNQNFALANAQSHAYANHHYAGYHSHAGGLLAEDCVMLRRFLFAFAGLAIAAFLAAERAPHAVAAPAEVAGSWIMVTVTGTAESTVCIVKVETKDGKPTASVVFSPENVEVKVSDFRVTESRVYLTVKQTRMINNQKFTSELAFVGERGTDAKVLYGSVGTATARTRSKLIATDKEKLEKDELFVRNPAPEAMIKATQLSSKVILAQNKVLQEKDAEKKKELTKELTEARKEADEKIPGFYREVIEKGMHFPAAYDAAIGLLRNAKNAKVTADEASKLVNIVQKHAQPYGPLFTGVNFATVADSLAGVSGLENAAVTLIEPTVKSLSKDDPVAIRVNVLSAYQNALTRSGKTDAAKMVSAEIAKLEEAIDAEYLKTVPPFKPVAFAGRKDKDANQVVVMELFTGAQCPPCVAADVGFDALLKSYKPSEVVLIQYHLHVPGPDPLTNLDAIARSKYYGVTGTPSTYFNGTRAGGTGGTMPAAENKYKQYCDVINPLLEKKTDVKLSGRATRAGDKIDIAVDVAGGNGDEMKLRIVVVEENVKYVGSNQLRFHHQVVRAMPTGAEGVAVKDKSFKHTTAVDLTGVRKNLTKYLDDYAANVRPFPKADRPMDMKSLKVIAFVQNDSTKEIVQAIQLEIDGKAAGQ
jgi:hypothetical protein